MSYDQAPNQNQSIDRSKISSSSSPTLRLLSRKSVRRGEGETETYLFPDLLPDDPRHLVSVQLDDGVLDLDLGRYGLLRVACELSFPSGRRCDRERVVVVVVIDGLKGQGGNNNPAHGSG